MQLPNIGGDQHKYPDTFMSVASGRNAQPGRVTEVVAAYLNTAFLELLTTQEKFGATLGIPRSTVGEYLRGVRVLDLETFNRICVALDVDSVDIYRAAIRRVERERGTEG